LASIEENETQKAKQLNQPNKRNSTSHIQTPQDDEQLSVKPQRHKDKHASSPRYPRNSTEIGTPDNPQSEQLDRKDVEVGEKRKENNMNRSTVAILTSDIDFSSQKSALAVPIPTIVESTISETTENKSPKTSKTISLRTLQPEANPSPSPSPGQLTTSTSDKVIRAKTGIVSILREIHSILTDLNQTVTVAEDLQTLLTCVKLVKSIKEELSKSSEVITIGEYNVTLPTKTDNKLEALKGHWHVNVEAVNYILRAIAKDLGSIQLADQLVFLYKLLKSVLDAAKLNNVNK